MPVCPRCRVDLEPRTVLTDGEWGIVTVDACPPCGGLWVDAEDQRADATVNLLYDRQLAEIQAGATVRPDTEGAIACPGCGGEMLRFDWNNRALFVDRCTDCQGYWLDAGEASRISG